MTDLRSYKILTFLISIVWFINGLLCKVLNLVPRHEQIVSRILGNDYSRLFTLTIGLLEILIAIWILSGYKSKLNTITQILSIATMNIIEFLLVPDLLLWGKFNALFAITFIVIIYYKEFKINKLKFKEL